MKCAPKIESTQTRQAVAAGRAMGVVFMAGSLGWVESNGDDECVAFKRPQCGSREFRGQQLDQSSEAAPGRNAALSLSSKKNVKVLRL